jgi:TPR repeat protein
MRIPSAARITSGRGVALASALCIAAGLGFGTARGPALSIAPAFAFDGTTTPNTAALTPNDGLRNTNHPLVDEKAKALTALQYAAEQGQPAAQWKLGRMYADGDGVPQDQMRAFNYFSEIANTHPDESPGTAQARFVANAFVSLGHYYLSGIPNSKIKPNAARARELLFQGQHVPRQAARGLMWLTLSKDCVGPDESWVKPLYDNAFRRASDDERQMALVYLEGWLRGRRD